MNTAVAFAIANKIFGLIDMGINYMEVKKQMAALEANGGTDNDAIKFLDDMIDETHNEALRKIVAQRDRLKSLGKTEPADQGGLSEDTPG